MFKNLPRLQEEVAADPGAAAAPTATPAATPTPTATPAATPAATPSSALAAAAPVPADPNAWIPEKVRVMKEDGTLDIEASFRKTTESYTNLERRFGTGDVPPATPEEYKLVGLPDTVNVDELRADPGMKSFLQAAHANGMTDKQVAFAISQHAKLLNENGYVQQLDQAGCDEYLAKVWPDDKSYAENKGFAFKAAEALCKKSGISIEDVEAAGLGNNPLFIRMLAAIGPEIGEDTSVQQQVTASEQETIQSLMSSPAYLDPKNPDHAKTSEKVRSFYAKKFAGQTPV